MRMPPTIHAFLNPIGELQSYVRFGVKKEPFDNGDTLTSRIMKQHTKVSLKDCQERIRHSVSFFERCLALQEKL